MKLFTIHDYREQFPDLVGSDLTDALVRQLLARGGICDAVIARTQQGKPYLASFRSTDGRHPGKLHFSVSHSGNLFACILSQQNIGLDIQQRRPVAIDRMCKRYFTQDEQNYVRDYGEDGFFRIWTRKEAYAKYTGEGLIGVLSGASVLDCDAVEFTDISLGADTFGCFCVGAHKRK